MTMLTTRCRRAFALSQILLLLVGMGCLAGAVEGTWIGAANLHHARRFHTSTVLADGRLLVSGGDSGGGPIATCELFDPATNDWVLTGSMLSPRAYHSAALLSDGSVLVIGGSGAGAACEVFSPATLTWRPVGSLSKPRNQCLALRLAGGQVLVCGGVSGGDRTRECEVYNPATETWFPTGDLHRGRYYSDGVVLGSGEALITGGTPNEMGTLATCELYNPSTGEWRYTTNMPGAQYAHHCVLLNDGRVLANGYVFDPVSATWSNASSDGITSESGYTSPDGNDSAATLLPSGDALFAGGYSWGESRPYAWLYKTATNTYSGTPNMNAPRNGHTLSVVDGRALVVGGEDDWHTPLRSCEWFDASGVGWSRLPQGGRGPGRALVTLNDGRLLAIGGQPADGPVSATCHFLDATTHEWVATGSLNVARESPEALRLSNGKILVIGGRNTDALASCELFDPSTNTWASAGSMSCARSNAACVELPSGKILVAGGFNALPLATADVFDPETATWSAAAPMAVPRSRHAGATVVGTGALVSGGVGSGGVLTSCELYDEASNTWSPAGSLAEARRDHSMHARSDGTIIAVGGRSPIGQSMASCEATSSPFSAWSSAPTLQNGRYEHAYLVLLDGSIVVSGGVDSSDGYAIRGCERLAPGSLRWEGFPALRDARFGHAMGIVIPGQIVVVGGETGIQAVVSDEITNAATVDALPPVVSIGLPAGPLSTVPIPISITVSEPVTGLDVSDLVVTGASVSDWSMDGLTATAKLTPSGTGTIVAVVGASAVVDAAGHANAPVSDSVSFTLLPPTITSPLSAHGFNGFPISYAIAASYLITSFNAVGLPPGLSIDTATGDFAGSPSENGVFTVTLSATNLAGTTNGTLTLTVEPSALPVITSALTASGTPGAPFAYQITATGHATAYAATGLPDGMSLNPLSGLISGTPTAAGSSSVTISATNAVGSDIEMLVIAVEDGSHDGTTDATSSSSGGCGAGASSAMILGALLMLAFGSSFAALLPSKKPRQ